jgi:signal transduction histidine kinase
MDTTDKATNDSIKKYLDLAGNDSLNVKHRNKYNDKAFSLVDLNKNDTLTRYHLSSISLNYLNTNNLVSFFKIGSLHLEKSFAADDTLNLARYYRYKAGYLKKKSEYDSSFYYYNKAEKFYKRTSDKYGLAFVHINKGEIQFLFDDYSGADLSAKKAYAYFRNSKHKRLEFDLSILIGNINHINRDYENAIKSYKKGLFLIEKYKLRDKNVNLIATCLNNIGNAYREQTKYSEAMQCFYSAIKEKNLIKEDPVVYGFLLNNLSYCKLKLKDHSGFPNLLFKSIELLNNSDEGVKESTISYVYLSNYYTVLKDTLKSQLFANKALEIAKNAKAPYYYLTALSNAGSVNTSKAPQYIKEYHQKNDSLLFIERNKRNQFYKIQLETDEITQEKEKAINQKWFISIISGVIILILSLLFVISRQRNKQKELQLLQEQQKANEEIYELMLTQKSKEEEIRKNEKKRIALELHDGVMNKLASTRLNLDVLKYKKDAQTIEKCVPHIAEIYNIEQEIRNITHDLSQEAFVIGNSFSTLMNDFLNSQNSAYPKTQCKLEIEDAISWNSISSTIKMNLFRIVQEATHNINKFAKAKNVVISFVLDEQNICLSITDNGKGFDPENNTDGIGLKNIKQRVDNLNGNCVIQSIKNKSTSINIAIPLK